jgi:hypothetical protein
MQLPVPLCLPQQIASQNLQFLILPGCNPNGVKASLLVYAFELLGTPGEF